MLAPIFTHGTLENTIKAIMDGKIKYPAYCWLTDVEQYGFLNKNNKLETISIPCLTGTLENEVILSTLYDGLYQVKGQHKITANDETTYLSSSYILCVVQTINGKKKVKRITADEVINYEVEDDLSVTRDAVVTEKYLEEKGYADKDYIDAKIVILKEELEAEIADLVEPLVEPIVDRLLDEKIDDIDKESIDDLFDE